MSNFKVDDIPQGLINAFKEQRGSLFIGAGLSVSAGLPTWAGLIQELLDEVKNVTRISQDDYDSCVRLSVDSNKFLLLAEELRDRLGNEAFRQFVIRRFDTNSPQPTALHEKLVNLLYNFIVTTNYDTLIEDAFASTMKKVPSVYNYDDSSDIANSLWDKRRFILKAHGDAKIYKDGIVMTEQDYRKLIFSRPGYQAILQVIFTTNTLLFLGASLSDPEIKMFLSYLRNAYHGGGPIHYALIAKDKIDNIE
ncbi:MAG: hypothetical protein EOP45_11270 [Sphingobacteriaceae bacterium]|nr:MAG: hypothetical protein EOP45_11270 [Sphingobacteriaceae bacterium]